MNWLMIFGCIVVGSALALAVAYPLFRIGERWYEHLPTGEPPSNRYLNKLGDLIEGLFGGRRFTVAAHEETEWGTMFAIIAPSGQIVGYDRYVPARQRCSALNAELANS